MLFPLVDSLKKYMLTEERIDHYLSYSIHNKINKKEINCKNDLNDLKYVKEVKKIANPFFIPRQKDTLFWCFYILVNGIDKYENLNIINIVVEKNLKIEYVERLRLKKDLLKMHKCGALLHLENSLVNEQKIDIKTFIALCILENINVIYVKQNCYFELQMNSQLDVQIIHFFPEKHKFGLEVNSFKAIEYRNSLYQITNVEKPIKAISSYKSEELVEIGEKLGLETKKTDGKTMLKKDIYEKIIQYLS
jgi:hypothetical protein